MIIPITNIKINKTFLITDTHFGARGNNTDWLDMMLDYFYNEFIPKVKQQIEPDDILICLGDVFDNRQNLNLQVLSKVIDLFYDLSKIFTNGVYVIAGNHDVMKKQSNDICSLDCLKFIPNINIYKEPHILESNNKKLLLLPWCHNHEDEKQIIGLSEANYVFCHTNIIGCKFDRYRSIDEGLSFVDFENVERVFSGHIHWSQQNGKVNILGTPYEITRSDSDNLKGYWIFNPYTKYEQHIINNYSPKFKRLRINDIIELTIDDIYETIYNSRLDLLVPLSENINIDSFVDLIKNICCSIETIPYEHNIQQSDISKNITDIFDFRSFLKHIMESKINNNELRLKILNKFDILYKEQS